MNYNPYFQQPVYNNMYTQPRQDYQAMQNIQQPPQPIQNKILQGKLIDNEQAISSVEIPYDFSISFFPMLDGSCIFSKQLLQDGTSKTIKYVPITEEEKEKELPKYLLESDLEEYKDKVDDLLDEVKDEIKELKKEIKARKDK